MDQLEASDGTNAVGFGASAGAKFKSVSWVSWAARIETWSMARAGSSVLTSSPKASRNVPPRCGVSSFGATIGGAGSLSAEHPVIAAALAAAIDAKKSRREVLPGSMLFHPNTSKARVNSQVSSRRSFASRLHSS